MRDYPTRFDPATGNQYDSAAQSGTQEAQERRERRRAWDALNDISASVYIADKMDFGILGKRGKRELDSLYLALEHEGVNDYSIINQKPVKLTDDYVSFVKRRLEEAPQAKTALWFAFKEIEALKTRVSLLESVQA